MVQALRADGSIPTIDPEAEDGVATDSAYRNLFDVARLDLLEHFESHTKALLTDSDASVRRAFLGSVSSLCVFFGSSRANDVVLSHLNTYLNDKDWMLKCSFFHTIVGVATFVGGSSLEDFILPLMVQALTDPEEFVVEKVLSSFASMAELGLFQRSKIWEMVDVVARFMVHPNIWIRQAAVHYVTSAALFLSTADTYCIVMPLLQPYLKTPIQNISETTILDALKRPLPRPVLEMAVTWALKVERGLFWNPVQQQRAFSFGGPDQAVQTISSKDLGPHALRKIPKNDEDEQWLTRLRNMGMAQDDEVKLLALREYIGRMATKRPKDVSTDSTSRFNGIISLEELKVTMQTVFFEEHKKQKQTQRRSSYHNLHADNARKIHTIADALLDASTTIDDPHKYPKQSYVNSRKERLNGDLPSLSLPIDSHAPSRTSSTGPSPLSSSPGTRNPSLDQTMLPPSFDSRRSSRLPNLDIRNNGRSDGTLSRTDSLKTGAGREKSPGVRHKSSAISLLNRRETSKSSAETATTTTNVIGQMDAPLAHESHTGSSDGASDKPKRKSRASAEVSGGHTYDGNDPNVQKLLDTLASENHASDNVDYGPLVTPISSTRILKKPDSQEPDTSWRPQGILVATFGEHTGPINRVLPSPDHIFFITASDDGSVKVWDTLRLERNLVHRSRNTHKHQEGSKVKSITFIQNTHTFVSCATDGSVHVVRVDCTHTNDTSKYGKLQLVRDYQLPVGEYAVWSEHFRADAKSVLLLVTNTSRILALDLRTMTILYDFENPVHHGTPTCFCLDRKHNWLLLGTSHGILDLWDLRFRLHLKAFRIAGGSSIHRLRIHPFKGHGRWICIAGGSVRGEIIVWDVEREQCREVYRTGSSLDPVKENPRSYELSRVDDEKPEAMLNRFATALEASKSSNNSSVDLDVRALTIGFDTDDTKDAKNGFLLTGGPDRKVRFWDLNRVESSTVVNGLGIDEPRSKFVTTHPTTSLTIYGEQIAKTTTGAGGATAKAEANTAAKRSNVRPPRSTVISQQQQQLLRSHLDVVLDVVFLEYPVGMTVSVDRAGVIYVFQ